jgi:hypothetical protein
MGNPNNIQPFTGGRMKRFQLPISCSHVRKKKGKNKKKNPNLSLRVKWRVQLTTYNNHAHKWGQVQKERKIILLAHNPKLHVFLPPSPP